MMKGHSLCYKRPRWKLNHYFLKIIFILPGAMPLLYVQNRFYTELKAWTRCCPPTWRLVPITFGTSQGKRRDLVIAGGLDGELQSEQCLHWSHSRLLTTPRLRQLRGHYFGPFLILATLSREVAKKRTECKLFSSITQTQKEKGPDNTRAAQDHFSSDNLRWFPAW